MANFVACGWQTLKPLSSGTLAIRHAKGGKPRHIILTDEGRELFAELTAGRKSDANVFLRDDGKGWGPAQQTRPIREACERVAIGPAIGFHVLRHTHATALAMAGVPMGVIAKQLGHADTRITERHYAHLAPSYVADTIRASFPKLGIERRIVGTSTPHMLTDTGSRDRTAVEPYAVMCCMRSFDVTCAFESSMKPGTSVLTSFERF